MLTPVLPRAQSSANGGGPFTREWYDYFRAILPLLLEVVDAESADAALIAEIIARLEVLEAETDATINGLASVSVFGSIESGLVQIQLLNDMDAPGNTYYYGTGPDGVKGWSTIRSALDFGDGIDLTTGSDGVTEISFNADTGEVAHLTGATYKTVQKTIDVMFSPGIITGGEVTELTTTSVRITAGTAVVRIADDNVSELRFFDFPSQDFSVPDVQVTHFYALDYNGGSPVIVETTVTESWDRDTQIPLGSALRGDGLLNITANPYRVGDVITNLIQRLDAIGPVQRDNSVGGLALGETGTRNVTVSPGRLWSRVSDFTIAAKNSSVDTMATVYFNGVNLTVTSGITQWDNLNFNNLGTGSLQLMGNNKYANLWFFMAFNGDHYGFAYGTNEYNTLGDAANEGVPAYLTQNFFNQFILLGRYIFQKSAATASIIESAFVTPFSSASINTHNNLGGLQGGTAGEFYHLTSAEYTKVQALPSASQPLDATLTALAGANWAANALPIGTGADTLTQTTFAANTFPARASTGNLVAKTITDFGLSLVDDASASAARTTLGALSTTGDTSPSGDYTFNGMFNVGTPSASLGFSPVLLVEPADGGPLSAIAAVRYSASTASGFFAGAKARGTKATPGAVLSGDALFEFRGMGYNSAGAWSPSQTATVTLLATENFTGSANGSRVAFRTTQNGSTASVTRWYFDEDGGLKPQVDNTYPIGTASLRASQVHEVDVFQYGARFETGVVSPAQLTANTDNWVVTGLSSASVIRASTNASRNLTGIASPTSGQVLMLFNIGAFDLVLVHDATSTAANRFLCPGSVNLTLNPNDSCRLWYDNTSSRWRVIGI